MERMVKEQNCRIENLQKIQKYQLGVLQWSKCKMIMLWTRKLTTDELNKPTEEIKFCFCNNNNKKKPACEIIKVELVKIYYYKKL